MLKSQPDIAINVKGNDSLYSLTEAGLRYNGLYPLTEAAWHDNVEALNLLIKYSSATVKQDALDTAITRHSHKSIEILSQHIVNQHKGVFDKVKF